MQVTEETHLVQLTVAHLNALIYANVTKALEQIRKADTPTFDRHMDVAGVAEYLKIPESTVYQMCRKSKIPATKVGRRWSFSVNAIDEWVRKGQMEISK